MQNLSRVTTAHRNLNCIWNKPNLFANASLCLDSSQNPIILSQSLINADFYLRLDIPWYFDEWALYNYMWTITLFWLCYITIFLNWAAFFFLIFILNKRFSIWIFTENSSFISFHGGLCLKKAEIYLYKNKKNTLKTQASKAISSMRRRFDSMDIDCNNRVNIEVQKQNET